MKRISRIKHIISISLVFLISINSFAIEISDNDGSAFITKAEFDALKNNFQAQIDIYNQSIDSKIDNAISSYLSGIRISKDADYENLFYRFLSENGNVGVLYNNQDTTKEPYQTYDGLTMLACADGASTVYESDTNNVLAFTLSGTAGDKNAAFFMYHDKDGKHICDGLYTSMQTTFNETDFRYSRYQKGMGGFYTNIAFRNNEDQYTASGSLHYYTDKNEPEQYSYWDDTATDRKHNKNWITLDVKARGFTQAYRKTVGATPDLDVYNAPAAGYSVLINDTPIYAVHNSNYDNAITKYCKAYMTPEFDEYDNTRNSSKAYEYSTDRSLMPIMVKTFYSESTVKKSWTGPMCVKSPTDNTCRAILSTRTFGTKDDFEKGIDITLSSNLRSYYLTGSHMKAFWIAGATTELGDKTPVRGTSSPKQLTLQSSFVTKLLRPKYITCQPNNTGSSGLYSSIMADFGVYKNINTYCWPLVDLSSNTSNGTLSFEIKSSTYNGKLYAWKIVNGITSSVTFKNGSTYYDLIGGASAKTKIEFNIDPKSKYYIEFVPSVTVTKDMKFETSSIVEVKLAD